MDRAKTPDTSDVYNFDEDSSDAFSPQRPASQHSPSSTSASPRESEEATLMLKTTIQVQQHQYQTTKNLGYLSCYIQHISCVLVVFHAHFSSVYQPILGHIFFLFIGGMIVSRCFSFAVLTEGLM